MKGQLWQECFCGTEPVCVDCERCAAHCRCAENAKCRRVATEIEASDPGFWSRLEQHLEESAREV